MDGLYSLCARGQQAAGGEQGWQPAGTIPAQAQHRVWGLGAAPELDPDPHIACTPQSPGERWVKAEQDKVLGLKPKAGF